MVKPLPGTIAFYICNLAIEKGTITKDDCYEFFRTCAAFTARGNIMKQLKQMVIDGRMTLFDGRYELTFCIRQLMKSGVADKFAEPATNRLNRPLNPSFYATVTSRLNRDAHYLVSGQSIEPFKDFNHG